MAANGALPDIIRRGGFTWDRLARAVNAVAAENGELLRTNRSSVSQWCGGKTLRPATVGYLAEALGRKLMRPVDPAEFGCPGAVAPAGLAGWGEPDPVKDGQWLGRADVDGRLHDGEVFSVAALALPVSVLAGTGEAACATWAQAFRSLEGVRSARVRRAAGRMRAMLKPLSGKRIAAVESVIAETSGLAR